MSDQQAQPPTSMGQTFPEGTPVYDLNGEQVGTVSQPSRVATMLILHKSIFFSYDLQVPLSTVQRSDPHGIYLRVTKDELQHERYAVPPATTAPGEDGVISRGVDVIEQNPNTVTQGVAVIEQMPDTVTQGVDVIEQTLDTVAKGTDTIEQNVKE